MDNLKLSSFGDWKLVRRLGKGGYGTVLQWKHLRTNMEIATKHLRQNNTLQRDEVDKLKQRWRQEHEWVHSLKQPFIVQGVDVGDPAFKAYLDERHAWHPLPVIVMEYCNGGDMRTHLSAFENLNGLHEYEVREVMRALRNAVEHLHTVCQIKHRDLKPDNIVVHVDEHRRRCYKLTDFGFARNISKETIMNSIVGTRNYFAPEIVVTSMYTNTVDYWSLGVIAFELMCGVLPFLPTQPIIPFLTAINKKPSYCIAITEDCRSPAPTADPNASPVFHEHLLAENRLSSPFVRRMEEWLRLALDVNYRTRGRRPSAVKRLVDGPSTSADAARRESGKLVFYTELDEILESKILTTFCVNKFTFHDFVVTPQLTLNDLVENIVAATAVPFERLCFIFPSCHPHPKLNGMAIDLFVEKWQDRSDQFNPPVMVFVVDVQCDYDAPSPAVSELIKLCQRAEKADVWPQWMLLHLVRHVHFLLSSEQRHLVTFVEGMREYALLVEHDLFEFDASVDKVVNNITSIFGRVQQHCEMIACAKSVNVAQSPHLGPFFDDWLAKANYIFKDIDILNNDVGGSIRKRYRSAHRRIQDLATGKIFDEWSKSDIYQLAAFRKDLQNRSPRDINDNLEACQRAVIRCIDKRHEFITDAQLKNTWSEICGIHKEFRKLRDLVNNTIEYLSTVRVELSDQTAQFHANLLKSSRSNGCEVNSLLNQMHSLHLDGASKAHEAQTFNDLFNVPIKGLLEEVSDLTELMELELSEAPEDSIPTTINS